LNSRIAELEKELAKVKKEKEDEEASHKAEKAKYEQKIKELEE
jgi:hypothetical protein